MGLVRAWITIGLCSLVPIAVAAAPAMGHYSHRSGARCGFVAGAPNTDQGAFDIRASGTGCRTARSVARRFMAGERRPRGYACRSRTHEPMGLTHRDVRCRRGDAVVSFALS